MGVLLLVGHGNISEKRPCQLHASWFEITWGPSQYKYVSYQYRDPHVKDKTVSPTVLSLAWESPYLGKTVFILRRGPDSVRKDPFNLTLFRTTLHDALYPLRPNKGYR